jgi:hypothetical protein
MMATSTPTPLRTPIVDGGIWSVNFFNGRLLSADTLSAEQAANRTARLQLGAAIGPGVAFGLEVTRAVSSGVAQPVVTVEPGLAVNRLGQTLELTERTDIALARADDPTSPVDALDFTDCPAGAVSTGTYRAGSGLFVLAIGPSESTSGRALVSGLGNDAPTCATAFSIEGVQFRLLRILIDDALLDDPDRLRNRVAYRFLGTASAARQALERDPFAGAVDSYGVDDLWDGCLDEREVPLGLVYWTADGGIEFVDRWAVRRRLAAHPGSNRWPLLAGDRVEREGEAMVLQFQDQLDDIRVDEPAVASTLRANDRFDVLPPVGLVPVAPAGTAEAFTLGAFFAELKIPDDSLFIEAGRFDQVVRSGRRLPPIEVTSEELVWVYRTRANFQPAAAAPPVDLVYLLFANGQAPYAADARFDLAYWDFANYSLAP